jgi:hypothetical protein
MDSLKSRELKHLILQDYPAKTTKQRQFNERLTFIESLEFILNKYSIQVDKDQALQLWEELAAPLDYKIEIFDNFKQALIIALYLKQETLQATTLSKILHSAGISKIEYNRIVKKLNERSNSQEKKQIFFPYPDLNHIDPLKNTFWIRRLKKILTYYHLPYEKIICKNCWWLRQTLIPHEYAIDDSITLIAVLLFHLTQLISPPPTLSEICFLVIHKEKKNDVILEEILYDIYTNIFHELFLVEKENLDNIYGLFRINSIDTLIKNWETLWAALNDRVIQRGYLPYPSLKDFLFKNYSPPELDIKKRIEKPIPTANISNTSSITIPKSPEILEVKSEPNHNSLPTQLPSKVLDELIEKLFQKNILLLLPSSDVPTELLDKCRIWITNYFMRFRKDHIIIPIVIREVFFSIIDKTRFFQQTKLSTTKLETYLKKLNQVSSKRLHLEEIPVMPVEIIPLSKTPESSFHETSNPCEKKISQTLKSNKPVVKISLNCSFDSLTLTKDERIICLILSANKLISMEQLKILTQFSNLSQIIQDLIDRNIIQSEIEE